MNKSFAGLLLAVSAMSAHAAVLYSNGPVVDGNGLSVLTAPALTFGYAANAAETVADDFTVTGPGWNVASLDFYAYQTNASGFTFASATWALLAGANINTATVVASGTTAVTNGGFVGYRVASTTPTSTARAIYDIVADIPDVTLAAGSYWLSWTLAGTSASGPFVPPVSLGAGNAQQAPSATGIFAPATDAGNGESVELPFAINGNLVTTAIPEPGELALFGLGAVVCTMVRRRRSR